jgi:hypothetical protein
MYSHGTQTRIEWKVTIRRSDGTTWTDWRSTEASAEAMRERYDVVRIERASRVLDF